MNLRFDALRIADAVLDVAVVGAVVSVFALVWGVGLIGLQIFLTCALVAGIAAFIITQIEQNVPIGGGPLGYRPLARQDTISKPVAPTDPADDRWAGMTLDEAMDMAEAEEEEAQPPVE